jgi:hypothetical protein
MNHDSAIKWFSTWRAKEMLAAILGAAGGFILAAVLLVLAWGFIFMVTLYIGSNWTPYLGGWVFPLIATAAIPLLFVGNACVRQETLGKYALTTGTATDKLVTIPGYGSNVNPLAPNSIITALKIVADVLFCGPRVTVWSFRQVGRVFRLLSLDVAGCAAVLTILHDAGQRMSYHDISESIEGLNPVRVFNQLRLLDGVLFLQSDPPGLSIGTNLKKELDKISQPLP